MAFSEVILIHYGELALKGRNRSFFEKRLVDNIKAVIKPAWRGRVRRLYGRMVLELPDGDAPIDRIEDRLGSIFGIASYGRARMADATWENLLEVTDSLLPRGGAPTFGVRAKKADGRWPRGRSQTERELGAWIVENRGWKVDLGTPDIWVRVELTAA